DPSDVSVLRASREPTLTLVTCYPFDYVGSAPQRFIVTARLVQSEPRGGHPKGRLASRRTPGTAPALRVAAAAPRAHGALWWWPRGRAYTIDRDPEQNVLLVTIDTLRADALSAYGGAAQTPNLDRLAAHGARFTFVHAHTVVTLPSHTSILSGLLPYDHGIR